MTSSVLKIKKFCLEKIPFRYLRTTIIFQNNLGSWINYFKTLGKGNDLNALSKFHGTDKWGIHFYTPVYKEHFKKFKYRRIKIFEIGVGEYEHRRKGGGSLRMWKRYFPFAK